MIDVTADDGVWQVCLNRPDKANALTQSMLADIADAADAATQAQAKVWVLTGKGRVFSAGADLEAVKAGLATDPVWERCSAAIAEFPGLSIAALNGSLAGGAFGMALACDMRIAVPEAKFFYPVMKMGILPQPSDPGRLTALVGAPWAKHILLGGAKLTADKALDIGLITQIVERSELSQTVGDLSSDALSADIEHVIALKRMLANPATP